MPEECAGSASHRVEIVVVDSFNGQSVRPRRETQRAPFLYFASFLWRKQLAAYYIHTRPTSVRTPLPNNLCGRGWRDPGSAHGSHSLGSTPNVVDLTAGDVTARVKYTPIVTPEAVSHPAFQANFHFGKPRGI